MNYETVGIVRIDDISTPIRKYENGLFGVEASGSTIYSGKTLNEIINKLDKDHMEYNIF